MALMGRTEIGLRDIGTSVTVPNDPKAKLMFYLSCVTSVLTIGEIVPNKLTNYRTNYNRLSEDEITELLAHCLLFSPDVLKDRCFFEDNTTPGISNKFLELSSVESSMLIAGDLVIGGQNRKVAKIMTYTRRWIANYYEEPMVLVLAGQICRPNAATRPAAIQAAPQRNNRNSGSSSGDCCCVVM